MSWFGVALASAVFSAFAAILEKKILFSSRLIEFVWLGSMLAAISALPLLPGVSFESIGASEYVSIFVRSLFLAVSYFLIMRAIQKREISRALPWLAITPGVVAFCEWLFFGQKFRLGEIAGLALLLIGIYLLERVPASGVDGKSRSGKSELLLAVLLMALGSLVDKYVLGRLRVDPASYTVLQTLFVAGLYCAMFATFARSRATHAIRLFRAAWLPLIGLGAATVIYRHTQNVAAGMAPIALVLAIKRLSILFASMAGGALFKESYLARKAAAISIILAGAILITLK